MILEYPVYYSKFRCIAGACPDTCCRGWELDIDDETYYLYQTAKGEIGDRIRSLIREEDGYRYFALKEDGACPFLEQDGLCEIIRKLGYDHLCQSCDEYPRYFVRCGDYEQRDISISCPVAAELLFAEKKLVYCREEVPDEEEPEEEEEEIFFTPVEGSSGEDDPGEDASESDGETDEEDSLEDTWEEDTEEDETGEEEEGEEEETPFTQEDRRIRDEILADRDRVLAVLSGEDGQTLPERLKRAGIFYEISAEEVYRLCLEQEPEGGRWEHILADMKQTLERKDRIGAAFFREVPGADGWFTRLASYLVFRYWIDAFFERKPGEAPDLLPEIRLTAGCLVQVYLQCLGVFEKKGVFTAEDMAAVARAFSRQVEHSDVNVQLLKKG